MYKTALFICLLLIQGVAWADAPTTQPTAITGTLNKPHADPAKVATAFGYNGVLFMRSQERWDQLNKLLPDLTPNTPLPKFDFAKQNVVIVYRTFCRRKDEFSLGQTFDLAAKPPQIECYFRWDGAEQGQSDSVAKFIVAVIPATSTVKVSVNSLELGVIDGIAALEFSATLGGKDGGDIVNGLQAKITSKAPIVKLGEDILVSFELHLAKMPDAKAEHFGSPPKSIAIWDAAYSKGYRNYGFFVTTPDGKTTLLKPKEHGFNRNMPHPVMITADQPYPLHEGPVADAGKSLKALGLDTSAPGTYTITGLYEETGSTARTKGETDMWGGSIASNTITVEVQK